MFEMLSNLPPLTLSFIAAITILTAYMVIFRFDHVAVSFGPTILTTIGIFGCFLGIALGLLHFNTSNIQGSIPEMVNGIKTSFWASVFGIGGALLIKFRLLTMGGPPRKPNEEYQGATIDDLANLLQDLHRSLAGKEDSTLISQIKLLRQDSNDRFDRLKKSFDNCLEKIADSNSKALIQALQEVIRDFNTKINEQFGENFKQLNAAVEKIVVWQGTYKNQVAEMIEQQKTCARSMTEATLRYAELVNKAHLFVDVSTQLGSLLKGLETQRTQMDGSLRSLGELLTKASGSLPEIEKKIVEMTQQVGNGVRANNEQIAATIKGATQFIQTSNTEMKQLLSDSIKAANQELSSHIKQISEKTKEQVVALDTALGNELTKALETLGRQLTALSQKFVEDYTPLTDKLRQVVQLSRGV